MCVYPYIIISEFDWNLQDMKSFFRLCDVFLSICFIYVQCALYCCHFSRCQLMLLQDLCMCEFVVYKNNIYSEILGHFYILNFLGMDFFRSAIFFLLFNFIFHFNVSSENELKFTWNLLLLLLLKCNFSWKVPIKLPTYAHSVWVIALYISFQCIFFFSLEKVLFWIPFKYIFSIECICVCVCADVFFGIWAKEKTTTTTTITTKYTTCVKFKMFNGFYQKKQKLKRI